MTVSSPLELRGSFFTESGECLHQVIGEEQCRIFLSHISESGCDVVIPTETEHILDSLNGKR
jgi:hypothetical protein